MNKRFYERVAQQKALKSAKRRVFKGLAANAKGHKGHGERNRRAQEFNQAIMQKKYLRLWLQTFVESREESISTQRASVHLSTLRKHQLLKAWRSATLEL